MRNLLFAALALAAVPQGKTPFDAPVTVDVGPGSGEILIADVNRDGNPDIITKHLVEKRIGVSLGDGSGHFRRGASISLPFGPGAISLGDMNRDGAADILIATRHEGGELAGVYPGDGRGGFIKTALMRVNEATQFYKPAVLAADINEDGVPDLVTSNGRRNTIEYLVGDGQGGFAAPRSIALEPSQDRSWFVLADLNGDKHLDIVSSSGMNSGEGDGQVDVAFGDGRGQFRRQAKLIVLRGPRVEAAADINGDGHIDVVISHPAPELTVLFNDGHGRLLPPGDRTIGLPVETHAVVAQDLNGDGQVDLAAATDQTVSVFFNRGGGVFSNASTFRAGPGAYKIAVGDLNNDRKPDAVASSFEGSALTLLFGR